MSFLLSRSAVLGVGLGLSLSLHPLSPFRASPMQCQYSAPYYRPDSQASPDSPWAMNSQDPLLRKQGTTRPQSTGSGLLTASNMRQVSMGSVLGLVVGVGLRAFSRALVVLIGMGVVVIEVCHPVECRELRANTSDFMHSGPRPRGIISCHCTACRNTSKGSISKRPSRATCPSRSASVPPWHWPPLRSSSQPRSLLGC